MQQETGTTTLERENAVEALRAGAQAPFDDARAMHPSVYTSPEILARERELIFAHEWICVGRASVVANPGDYLTCEIADQPIIVLRDLDGVLRALSNVCLHRMSVLLEGTGRSRSIVCPYHAWTYNLDGTLRAAPQMDHPSSFCREAYRLPELRVETWRGWIYVTLDPSRPPVAEHFAELDALIARYGMEDYVETFREEHVWDTNWKILAENFMESYHLPMLHHATVGPHSRIEEMECPPGRAAFNYHWITKDATLPIGNAHPDNRKLEGDWRRTVALLAIYPTQLVSLTPGYFWYLLLSPRGVGRVHMVFGGGLAPEFIRDPRGVEYMATLKSLLDAVNAEDRRGVEDVFRGVRAPLARPGHLSYLERPNYDFARYLAAKLTG